MPFLNSRLPISPTKSYGILCALSLRGEPATAVRLEVYPVGRFPTPPQVISRRLLSRPGAPDASGKDGAELATGYCTDGFDTGAPAVTGPEFSAQRLVKNRLRDPRRYAA